MCGKGASMKRLVIIVGVVSCILIIGNTKLFTKEEQTKIVKETNKTNTEMIVMYQENDSGTYDEITTMPTEGYIINEEESYCTIDGTNRDTNARLYTNEAGEHVIKNLQ